MTITLEAHDVQPCEHPDCAEDGIPCFLYPDLDTPHEWFCPTHAAENGYCASCGIFSSGIESFDFLHPGYCDNCWDEIEAENAEPDEDDEYVYDRMEDLA